jgi:hypothetical protein
MSNNMLATFLTHLEEFMNCGLVTTYKIIYLFYTHTTVTRNSTLSFQKPYTTAIILATSRVYNAPLFDVYLYFKAGLLNPLGALALVACLEPPNELLSPL